MTPRFVDRSRVVTDWACPRRRWWAYELGGLGVQPATRPLYFDVGDAIHKAFSALTAAPGRLDATVEETLLAFQTTNATRWPDDLAWKLAEQSCLIEGLIRGWHRLVLPRILSEYTLLATEEEFPFPVNDWLTHGVKPDRLLLRKVDETVWYRETKTTAHLGPTWSAQWTRAIQLHATAHMVGTLLGRAVEGVVIEGVYKGYEREGKATSIFCYGYTRPGTVRGPEVAYEWRAGSRKAPVWEMRGGVKAWVAQMPNEILAQQFVESPPVFLQTRLVEAYLSQLAAREGYIAEMVKALGEGPSPQWQESLMNEAFPQHFSQCHPAIGTPCGYINACFNDHVGADPVASGLYLPRVPHHKADPACAHLRGVELAPGTWIGEVDHGD